MITVMMTVNLLPFRPSSNRSFYTNRGSEQISEYRKVVRPSSETLTTPVVARFSRTSATVGAFPAIRLLALSPLPRPRGAKYSIDSILRADATLISLGVKSACQAQARVMANCRHLSSHARLLTYIY